MREQEIEYHIRLLHRRLSVKRKKGGAASAIQVIFILGSKKRGGTFKENGTVMSRPYILIL